jgi:hypothetical protein
VDNYNSFEQIDEPDSSSNNSHILQKIRTPLQYDSSIVTVRYVDSAKILIHLKDKDFKYFEDPEYSKTLWERLMDWLNRQFAKLTEYDSYYTAWDIFMYILIALAVAAIIFGFYRSEFKGLLISSKKNDQLNISESLEDIHALDYEKMIEEAITKKNFRYAIRLNYLRSLKILSDKNLIHWKTDKTNNEFINEIKQISLKEKFKNITYDFEYIWYGEFEIDQTSYNQLQNQYSDFNSSLETV